MSHEGIVSQLLPHLTGLIWKNLKKVPLTIGFRGPLFSSLFFRVFECPERQRIPADLFLDCPDYGVPVNTAFLFCFPPFYTGASTV